MRHKLSKILSLFLSTAMVASLFTGCGVKEEKLPELLEPAALTEWYYAPFEYEVGTPEVYMAKVFNEEETVSFDISVLLGEVCVMVGDKVKKGDVIATVNVDDSKKALETANSELKSENTKYDLLTKDLEKTKTENNKLIAEINSQGGDSKRIEELKAIIAVAEENYRYETILHNKIVNGHEENIQRYTKLIDNSVLYSPCDGVISQVIHGYTDYVSTDQVVANIILEDQRVIVPYLYDRLNASMSAEYENYIKKIVYKGVEYDAEEIKYTPEEYMEINVTGKRLPMKFTFEKIDEVRAGDNLIIRCYPKLTHSEKTVLLESLHRNEGDAIYVKGESGNPEKRLVTVGAVDDHYAQILDGLNDGDLVYSATNTLIPSEGAQAVKVEDYVLKNHTDQYFHLRGAYGVYYSDIQGTITAVSPDFVKGNKVNVGDYLYSLETGEGAVKLKEAEIALKRVKKEYKDIETMYDRMIKQITGDSPEEKAERTNLVNEKNKELAFKQTEVDVAQTNYKVITDSYDKDGNLLVYSKFKGTIQEVNAEVGMKVAKDQHVYGVDGDEMGDLLEVYVSKPANKSCDENDGADYGEEVLIGEESAPIKGKVVAGYFNMFKLPTEPTHYFFVKTEIPASEVPRGKVMEYNLFNLAQGVIVDNGKINEETLDYSGDKFVWVERNGYPVKQYILDVDKEKKDTVKNPNSPYMDKTKSETLILYGLKSGDKIY